MKIYSQSFGITCDKSSVSLLESGEQRQAKASIIIMMTIKEGQQRSVTDGTQGTEQLTQTCFFRGISHRT